MQNCQKFTMTQDQIDIFIILSAKNCKIDSGRELMNATFIIHSHFEVVPPVVRIYTDMGNLIWTLKEGGLE